MVLKNARNQNYSDRVPNDPTVAFGVGSQAISFKRLFTRSLIRKQTKLLGIDLAQLTQQSAEQQQKV